jgi:hypothetical protein
MAVEVELPRYPALAKAFLLEARHSVRIELVKDLKASLLFDYVVEATSIGNGLGMIEAQEGDAYFIGPSVTKERVFEFLEKGDKAKLSKDLAFVVIADTLLEGPEEFLEKGAHGVIRRPYSKAVFTEGTIRAVIAANGNGAWATMVKKQGGQIFEGVDGVGSGSIIVKPMKTFPYEELAGKLVAYIKGGVQLSDDELSSIQKCGDNDVKQFNRSIVDAFVGKTPNVPGGNIEAFKTFFEKSLNEWIENSKFGSITEATSQLRLTLLNYVAPAK